VASPDPMICAVGVKILFHGNARILYDSVGPTSATSGSAGFDLVAALPENSSEIDVAPGERVVIPTGISIEPTMPCIAGFVYSRSGLGAVKGIAVAQGVGLIDPDYRGEILVYLLNTSSMLHRLRRGDRVAQLVFQPFFLPKWEICDALGDTTRGSGGFGHTGR